jgi:hypothetical protein
MILMELRSIVLRTSVHMPDVYEMKICHKRSPRSRISHALSHAFAVGLIFVFGLFLFAPLATAAPDAFSMQITFTNVPGGATLTNFPALVILDTSNTVNYAGFLDITSGYDLRFWTNATFTGTELNYEIESFDNTGSSYIWVQIPALTNDMPIWATWGDAAYTDQMAYTTNGDVWSEGYIGVWHFNETSGSHADSAAGNTGTANGAVNQDGTGQIAGGDELPGGDTDYIDCGDIDAVDGATQLTVSVWARVDYLDKDATLVTKGEFGAGQPLMLWRDDDGNVLGNTNTSAALMGSIRIEGANDIWNDTGWHYTAITFVGGSETGLRLYHNGNEDANSPVAATNQPSLASPNINTVRWGGATTSSGKGMDGGLDEARISTVARSAGWIMAEYRNQGSPDAFMTYGNVQAPAGIITIANLSADGITADSARLNAVLTAAGTNADVSAYWWITGSATTNSAPAGSYMNALASNISYTVSGGLQADREYNFTFRASNSADDIWASPPLSFITDLSSGQKPVFTNAVLLSGSSIQLGWADNADHETGYILQRSTINGSEYSTIASPAANATSFTDSGLNYGTTYYYQLAATNSVNGGSATDFALCRASVTTPSVGIFTNTVTLDVIADTMIYSRAGETNKNFNNTSGHNVVVGYGGGIQRGLIRFDTSSLAIPDNGSMSVISAVLKVTNTDTGGLNDPDVGAYDYPYDFRETTATWINPAGDGSDSTLGGTIGTLLTSKANMNDTANYANTFDSSAEFVAAVETAIAGDNTINLLLKRPNDSGTSNDYIRFGDREGWETGYFQLDVTYILTLYPPAGTVIIIR